MKKGKRILAIIGVVILAALYLITLVTAIFATPASKDFFKISLLATIMIPLVVYIYMLVVRLVFGNGSEEEQQEPKNHKGFEEVKNSTKS